jgi:hypothetical protein
MRRTIAISLCFGLGLGLGACVTPSIPIPPPDPARMTFEVTVQGGASSAVFRYEPTAKYGDATVYVFNRDLGEGIITTARPDGSVGPTNPVAAAVGHQIVVTFQLDEQTASTCVRLRDGQQSSTDYCGP